MRKIVLVISFVLILAIMLAGCMSVAEYNANVISKEEVADLGDIQLTDEAKAELGQSDNTVATAVSATGPEAATAAEQVDLDEKVKVHVLDVGQADSIFIELPGHRCMLIDTGNYENANEIIDYVTGKGYTEINYLLQSHPHADHIGGSADVIGSSLVIDSIYMPNVVTDTKTFENMVDAINAKSIPTYLSKSGDKIITEDNLSIDVLSPQDGFVYDEMNDYSIVLKLTYGNTSFMFMGDATTVAEGQILNSGANVNAGFIKIGHHGSESSSSLEYIQAVNPRVAVVSVGADNKYGHPSPETMERLQSLGIEIHTTMDEGTVSYESDGNSIVRGE